MFPRQLASRLVNDLGYCSLSPFIATFPGHLAADQSCGKSKACFHDCQSGWCTFTISWRPVDDQHLAMTMVYRLPDNNDHWIAVGFSHDEEMGDDSVTECLMQDGQVKVQQSFNDGLFNNYLENRRAALSEESGRVEDGLLHCTFYRKKSFPRDPKVFDLNNDYFLLVASGEAIKGNKLPHIFDVLPPVSPHKLNLNGLENVSGEEPDVPLLVKLHGLLMIVSWILLTSIGVMTAKYAKPMFLKFNPCGVNIWLQIHRTCLILVLVCTVTGIALMAVHCEGYCQIPQMLGKTHWPLHPPLGILVLILTIINPIMAFLRPGPRAPNRYVFVWSHWGVGVLAWIMASLAIFIGLDLERAHAPPEAMYVVVGWGVYHIIFLVAMETLPRPLSNLYNVVAENTLQRGRMYNLEKAQQDNMGYQDEDENQDCPEHGTGDVTMEESNDEPDNHELTREELKVQRTMLMFHYCVVTIFTLTLVLVVYMYTPPQP